MKAAWESSDPLDGNTADQDHLSLSMSCWRVLNCPEALCNLVADLSCEGRQEDYYITNGEITDKPLFRESNRETFINT